MKNHNNCRETGHLIQIKNLIFWAVGMKSWRSKATARLVVINNLKLFRIITSNLMIIMLRCKNSTIKRTLMKLIL